MPTGISVEFETCTGPYRRELLVHCYRLLGSVQEAEDQVQETLLRAWRAWDRYDENLASVRTWLYKIATNTCLTALRARAHRPLPSGLGGPSEDTDAVRDVLQRIYAAWADNDADAFAALYTGRWLIAAYANAPLR